MSSMTTVAAAGIRQDNTELHIFPPLSWGCCQMSLCMKCHRSISQHWSVSLLFSITSAESAGFKLWAHKQRGIAIIVNSHLDYSWKSLNASEVKKNNRRKEISIWIFCSGKSGVRDHFLLYREPLQFRRFHWVALIWTGYSRKSLQRISEAPSPSWTIAELSCVNLTNMHRWAALVLY